MELRQYQKDICNQAVNMMKVVPLVYLAMEVRTGKTHCALEIAKRRSAKRVLFCTKKKPYQVLKRITGMLGMTMN